MCLKILTWNIFFFLGISLQFGEFLSTSIGEFCIWIWVLQNAQFQISFYDRNSVWVSPLGIVNSKSWRPYATQTHIPLLQGISASFHWVALGKWEDFCHYLFANGQYSPRFWVNLRCPSLPSYHAVSIFIPHCMFPLRILIWCICICSQWP